MHGDDHLDAKTSETHSAIEAAKAPRRRLDPDARHEQLLEHALAAFADAGIERAVHADVAQRAGVSTPTVFKYFQTRDVLVDAVLDRVETVLIELIHHIPEGANIPPADMIQLLGKALSVLCETNPNLMKVALSWSVAFSSVRQRYIDFENRKLDMLKARMSDQSTDRSDARILLASAILYIRMHFNESSEDVRQRYVGRMSEIFAAAPNSKK